MTDEQCYNKKYKTNNKKKFYRMQAEKQVKRITWGDLMMLTCSYSKFIAAVSFSLFYKATFFKQRTFENGRLWFLLRYSGTYQEDYVLLGLKIGWHLIWNFCWCSLWKWWWWGNRFKGDRTYWGSSSFCWYASSLQNCNAKHYQTVWNTRRNRNVKCIGKMASVFFSGSSFAVLAYTLYN